MSHNRAISAKILGVQVPSTLPCHLPCAICHLPCAICHVPSAMCHLPCAICHVPSAMCHLPCAICHFGCGCAALGLWRLCEPFQFHAQRLQIVVGRVTPHGAN